jgi:hypothetical protein
MTRWGALVICVAAILVGFALIVRGDVQAMTIVVGFAGSIVTGSFGLMRPTPDARRASDFEAKPPADPQ